MTRISLVFLHWPLCSHCSSYTLHRTQWWSWNESTNLMELIKWSQMKRNSSVDSCVAMDHGYTIPLLAVSCGMAMNAWIYSTHIYYPKHMDQSFVWGSKLPVAIISTYGAIMVSTCFMQSTINPTRFVHSKRSKTQRKPDSIMIIIGISSLWSLEIQNRFPCTIRHCILG